MALSASWALELPLVSALASLVLVTPLAFMASALGVGLGATYPHFNYENPVSIPMSFGGMMYVYWSLGTVLAYSVLMSWPLFMFHTLRRVGSIPILILTSLLALIAFALPIISGWVGFRLGVSRLDEEGGEA